MSERPPKEFDPSTMYDDGSVWGEHPQGVSVSDSIKATNPIKSENDFANELKTNEELSRRARLAQEAGNVMGIVRGSPSHIKTYVARELHHITDSKATKVIGIGAGAAITVFLVQHEMRKHVIPAIQRRREK